MSEHIYTAKDIKILSSIDSIRKRPGMYFGDIDNGGANHIIYELIANSIDQFLSDNASCIKINIESNRISVSDDGCGLPFDMPSPDPLISLAEYYLTNLHYTATADGHAPHVHIGKSNGLGLAAVTAGTAKLQIESSNGNGVWVHEYSQGKASSQPTFNSAKQTKGCCFKFTLDTKVFGDAKINQLLLRKDLFELIHFYPGLVVELGNERFVAKEGLLELAYHFHHAESLFTPAKTFHTQTTQDGIEVSIAALGTASTRTQYISWVNGGRSIQGGTHVNAMQSAFESVSWEPEVALVNVIMHRPNFASPTRDLLQDEKVGVVVRELMKKSLTSPSSQD